MVNSNLQLNGGPASLERDPDIKGALDLEHSIFAALRANSSGPSRRPTVTCEEALHLRESGKAARGSLKMYLHSAELNVVAVTENVNTFLLV